MPCFEGDFKVVGQIVQEVIVSRSRIITSELDMDNKKITSVAIPTEPLDVANKYYVDLRMFQVQQTYNVTLTGTQWTPVVNLPRGGWSIMVEAIVNDGPVLHSSCLKVKDEREAVINDIGSSRADTGERLELSWRPSQSLMLRKSGDNFDGEYLVSITKG